MEYEDTKQSDKSKPNPCFLATDLWLPEGGDREGAADGEASSTGVVEATEILVVDATVTHLIRCEPVLLKHAMLKAKLAT